MNIQNLTKQMEEMRVISNVNRLSVQQMILARVRQILPIQYYYCGQYNQARVCKERIVDRQRQAAEQGIDPHF